ncbi:hypothetical protein [Glaciecola sp. 33A]|uniref:hypothetical protein n=1 Tax=Glaciecola sp. 33A TaxID=2057807 RepID=UPI000C332341|nr:hypothetical protein [Glaciecola sp. 33A]PKI02517.1 hypothetical protein CXF81_06150 [Glaciecola sp. 33A]
MGLNFIPGCQVWCSAAFSAATTYAVTGSLKAAFTSGAITAATAYAFSEVGQHFNGLDESGSINFGGNMLTSGQVAQQITAHALVGGVSSSLQGGKFGHGFFSAGVTKGIGGAFLPGGDNLSSGEIAQGTVVSAVIGGTASKISGGKFANGAQTGAFQYLFNQIGKKVSREIAIRQAMRNLKETYKAGLQTGSLAIGAGIVRVGTYVYEHESWFSDKVLYSADGWVNGNGGRFLDLHSNAGAGSQGVPSDVSDWLVTIDEAMGSPDLLRLEARLGDSFDVTSIDIWNTTNNAMLHVTRPNGSSNDWSCSNFKSGETC